MKPYIRILDTTLRDGEQTPGVHLDVEEKIAIAQEIAGLGVDTLEAGFPASSPGDFEAVRRIAGMVRGCEVAALCRCRPQDIAAAAEALAPAERPVIHLVLGISEIHLEKKLGMSRAAAARSIAECTRIARSHAAAVQFSFEDATRADPIFLRQCVDTAIEHGATRVNLADTVGCALPQDFGALVSGIVAFAGPDIIVSAHCHNDMGLATANTIAAIQRGARQVEVTVNGIGERAGNTALEEVAVILHATGMARHGLDLTRIAALSARVAAATGVPVQPNRPVVGRNAFAHSSGIHQDGILKAPEIYEHVRPQWVGVAGHRFILTARSGRHAVAHVARENGFAVAAEELDSVYAGFIAQADATRGEVGVECLRAVVERVRSAPARRVAARGVVREYKFARSAWHLLDY
ncbi:MAG: 2-isopropylmalate synthase [Candidatus Hydrogenedentes bacterium]|nr:2-isopropylmalate synthase [Candidatus Hydrogenedentota bacterium]